MAVTAASIDAGSFRSTSRAVAPSRSVGATSRAWTSAPSSDEQARRRRPHPRRRTRDHDLPALVPQHVLHGASFAPFRRAGGRRRAGSRRLRRRARPSVLPRRALTSRPAASTSAAMRAEGRTSWSMASVRTPVAVGDLELAHDPVVLGLQAVVGDDPHAAEVVFGRLGERRRHRLGHGGRLQDEAGPPGAGGASPRPESARPRRRGSTRSCCPCSKRRRTWVRRGTARMSARTTTTGRAPTAPAGRGCRRRRCRPRAPARRGQPAAGPAGLGRRAGPAPCRRPAGRVGRPGRSASPAVWDSGSAAFQWSLAAWSKKVRYQPSVTRAGRIRTWSPVTTPVAQHDGQALEELGLPPFQATGRTPGRRRGRPAPRS